MIRFLGKVILRLSRWRTAGSPPTADRYVVVAAPHTTNWDLLYMLAIAWSMGTKLSWMGKHTLFRWPAGVILRSLGGIPIRRSTTHDVVAQMVDRFAGADALVLVIPAEGTRSEAPHWKSGFYHIARAADVPVVMGFLDYPGRVGGFGPMVRLTGDVTTDMDHFRAFYADIAGKHPERQGAIRLAEER